MKGFSNIPNVRLIKGFYNIGFLIFGEQAGGVSGDTGFQSPSSNGARFTNATNPTNAYTSDDSNATLSGSGTSGDGDFPGGNLQDWGTFGLSIPGGATIDGIEVTVEVTGSGTGSDSSVSLYDANSDAMFTPAASHKAISVTASEQTLTFGGSEDLWGKNDWTVSDFADGTFAVLISNNDGGFPGVTLSIDHIQVKVYYTT